MSPNLPVDGRWYAVHSKPRQEARAEANLRGWGLEIFAPKTLRSRTAQTSRRSPENIRPLFPGYLFARFDAHQQLTKVRLTRGVHSVVGFGESATPVDEEIIDFIRGQVGPDDVMRVAESKRGDCVEILDGPLRSLVGILEQKLTDQDRVVVLLTAIGAQTRVNVPRANVRTHAAMDDSAN